MVSISLSDDFHDMVDGRERRAAAEQATGLMWSICLTLQVRQLSQSEIHNEKIQFKLKGV